MKQLAHFLAKKERLRSFRSNFQVEPSVVTRSSFHFHLCTTFLFFKHHNVYSPSLGSLGDRRGYCYNFPHSFSFLCHCLPTFLWTSFLYIGFTQICLLIHSMLTQVLIHALLIRLFMRLFMHSLTVQYIRTAWTLLFCS